MSRKQAKAELKQILTQKTVSISRLKKVLETLDYIELEQAYINLGKNIKRYKVDIKKRDERIYNQKREIRKLRERNGLN